MKTKEELNQLKEEYTALATKLSELTDEELLQVIGGRGTNEYDEQILSLRRPVDEMTADLRRPAEAKQAFVRPGSGFIG